ncbi:N-formylglutamate amidohydrolase [Oricola cellulosilytica]|uniref:N-formylglutamate amidohydrolase n=1 Tax=Oricola cellulosilytica TaxID=1429082 RepID=A0A4R0P7C7_9HYPH|nr:N-formylglutamate amidohydrolase [Oricola cellulosilytica]TCD11399.1 N-formylglutamate amidohydrolase [Oricola cellulosilytica]
MTREIQPFDAVKTEGPEGRSPVLFLCEHASRAFPESFGELGLTEEVRQSHVAWDPGALPVAQNLARTFDAPLVRGAVSRLLYDCNRPPEAADAVPAKSEIFEIPGNIGLSEQERQRRVDLIYRPFCTAVDTAVAEAQPLAIVTVHSFTPVYFGKPRAVEIGLLHDTDSRLADAMLDRSGKVELKVARNQPYGPGDGVMHSLRLHAESRGLLNVMIEIRNDLVAQEDAQERVAGDLATLLESAFAKCGVSRETTS